MATGEEFKFPDESEQLKKEAVAQDEVEIEIVDDTPEKDRGRKPLDREVSDPSDQEIESYSKGVQDRIKELTHARHDERRQKEAVAREKEELERLAHQLLTENNRLKQTYNEGQQVLVNTARKEAETKLEIARRKLMAAQESFDSKAIVEAQEELAEAKYDAEQAKRFRPQSLQPTEIPVKPAYQPQNQVTPDEKTLRWQAKNQWFGQPGFEEYTSYALGLHQKLVNGGVDPRSDDYFDQIDGRMKSKFPEIFGENEEKPKTVEVQRKPTTVVAPAARTTSTGKIRLTQTQVALAKKFGLTPQQYAAQVARLENQNG